jgi:DNA-binding IclR family transcriptional regulator
LRVGASLEADQPILPVRSERFGRAKMCGRLYRMEQAASDRNSAMSGVQSVERALSILRALSAGPAGVTELAERVDLAKSTVSRMLSTLEDIGAVAQVESGGRYRLGPLMAEIAGSMAPTKSLVESAHPLLAELSRATGEAVGLSVREDGQVRYILQTAQTGEVQVRDWTGFASPLHVGAAGVVLLAYAPDEVISAYVAGELAAFTSKTVVDRTTLASRLDACRTAGYEWVFGEFSEELNSVAAPVRDRDDQVIAAIHVHGPTFRFPGIESADTIAKRVVETANRLTQSLRQP